MRALTAQEFCNLRAHLEARGFCDSEQSREVVDALLRHLEDADRTWEAERALASVRRLLRRSKKAIDPARRLHRADVIRLFGIQE